MSLHDSDGDLKADDSDSNLDKAGVRKATNRLSFSNQPIQKNLGGTHDSLATQSSSKLISLADMLNTLNMVFPMTESKMDVEGFQLALKITNYRAKRSNIDPTMDDLLSAIEFLD